MENMTESCFYYGTKKLSYYSAGTGRPVVFLGGFGTPLTAADFYPIIESLGSRYRCIAVDRFGYGKSDGGDNQTFEQALGAFIKSLHFRDLILVAHSVGTLYALNYAKKNPTGRLVLIDSCPVDRKFFTSHIREGKSIAKARKKGAFEKAPEKKAARLLKMRIELPPDMKNEFHTVLRKRFYGDDVLQELEQFKIVGSSILEGMENIKADTVLLCRRQTYKANLKYQEKIPHCKVINVGKSSSFIHHEFPLLLLKAIEET